ncbi:cell division protein FtsA [Ruminiclostridium papyrosolvens]|uniref:Cell division protein FtsA n=1 Tax=Ruminiclostridium papyrosolvens C7 TaxID=1330534 RepID=U4R406_9FIRM|nr:cell division FtsA domain-containing protein [Ruminiclostridium papyrosolvens]EPR13234.1 cell division protein FtsA [Ruminiclostridium papyrosolvens C7]
MPGKQKITKTKVETFNEEDLIFALDIGTRTVIGIVGVYEKECFRVVAAEICEHKSRAMLDGQIHDIEKVAEVITQVKERLEKILGVALTKVAIAAAGRVLKTSQTKLEYDIEQGREITSEIVGSLEVDAIQNAQFKLDNEISNEEKMTFYCVGYSVVNYFLNGYVISSLVGHKGKKIGVEVLATFLPHVVVDSLYTVMSKVGLEVISLTLEPIAAINVTIPKDLRLLNLVLVDIGAGTSDIAVTRDGSVVAYGMVPIAGDEITEKIAQEFLVDFNTAEKIKISISSGTENIKYTDILGNKYEITHQKAIEIIKPSIDFLAGSICDKILEFNQKAPNAVFLIGGGSQIPGLTNRIAEGLGLPDNRVAVRGRDVIQNIKTKIKKLTGPESITPFGIAMMAHMQRGQDFMTVTVNENKIKLFNSKKLSVADALILVGYNPDKLIGRSGKSLKFTLNGKDVSIKGEHGRAAEIFVNNEQASLDTRINNNDSIYIKPSYNGMDAEKRAIDYIKHPRGLTVFLNEDRIELVPYCSINGQVCGMDVPIKNGDKVQIEEIVTLKDFITKFEIGLESSLLRVNGEIGSPEYILKDNDSITDSELLESVAVTAPEQGFEEQEIYETDDVLINQLEQDNMENNSVPVPEKGFVIYVNGERIELKENKQYIFVDIFNYINFDLSVPKGNIILKLNGSQANFTDTISRGDNIEIYWENMQL